MRGYTGSQYMPNKGWHGVVEHRDDDVMGRPLNSGGA
jgi:hypothetical protein